MKFFKTYLLLFIISSAVFIGCKPKDSDLKAKVEKNLQGSPETSGVTVDVKDGVATLSGEVKAHNSLEKAAASAQDVNGIKSVVNNVTMQAPVVEAPPVEVNSDATMMQGAKDAAKDFPTVTANVNAGVITLTGSIKRSNLQTLMMSLNTLKPKKIDNQLTIK